MKHTKILAFAALLTGLAAEGQAQVFQIFQKDGKVTKFQATMADSLSYSDAKGLTTIHLKDGSNKTFAKTATDSVVCYDPTNSILATLRKKGNYTLFLRLVQENENRADMLNGATNLTVFAADDNSWQRFFVENAKLRSSNLWHTATSYEALTSDQKRTLLYAAIADDGVDKADVIRTKSHAAGLEALVHLSGNEVPLTYSPNEKWYWQRFHESKGGKGLYLATDSTFRYVSFFTPEKLKALNIEDSDIAMIFPAKTPAIANGVDVVQENIPATNGTIQSVAAPLVPLKSMAEVIRTNGKTNIFSHILDRFSAPFYCSELTAAYKALHPEFTDSIFNKRYFSNNSYKGPNTCGPLLYEPGPNGTLQKYQPYLTTTDGDIVPTLKFDPGWNGYWDDFNPLNARKDMAAMLVPNDKEMWNFFTESAGKELLRVYYARTGTEEEIPYVAPATIEELYRQIDCIPLRVISTLVNNVMLRSFRFSVPSMWGQIKNDAQEPLFYDVDADREKIDTCLLASNGVVYVMNKTCAPIDYCAVTAPAFIGNTNKIMKYAIYDPKDKLKLFYYAYLTAMQSRFTLFMPCDTAFHYYYDPVSMKNRQPRVIVMNFKTDDNSFEGGYANYYGPYNETAPDKWGTMGRIQMGSSALLSESDLINRIKDILYNHTIVNDETQDINSRNEYYRTYGGDVVKVVRDVGGRIVDAKGTFQIENERLGISAETPGLTECNVTESNEALSNGQTYTLNAPLVPTWRSLYSVLTNDDDRNRWSEAEWEKIPYSKFYDLCRVNEDLIVGCGLVDGALKGTDKTSALKKFRIFIKDNGLDFNLALLSGNTSYTAFIPTNAAVCKAIAQGLPTWEEICEDYRGSCKPYIDDETGKPYIDDDGELVYTDYLNTREDSIRIANKILTLTNFVKAHFCYDMTIVDNEPFQRKYTSLFIDATKMTSPKLTVTNMGGQKMTVTDWNGHTVNVTAERNVFVRDYACSADPVSKSMTGLQIMTHRSGVVHLIDGVLGFTGK